MRTVEIDIAVFEELIRQSERIEAARRRFAKSMYVSREELFEALGIEEPGDVKEGDQVCMKSLNAAAAQIG